MTHILPGDRITVRTATGAEIQKRALSGVVMGEDFRVVWACSEDEWLSATAVGRPPEGVPWPAEDVQVAQ